MRDQDFKHKIFLVLVLLLQLMHDQEIDNTMVTQTTHRIDYIFPDFVRHIFQALKEIECKIKELLIEKMCQ